MANAGLRSRVAKPVLLGVMLDVTATLQELVRPIERRERTDAKRSRRPAPRR
jgi:hypothetical protein